MSTKISATIDTCATLCRAKCCRAPGFLPLTNTELKVMKQHNHKVKVTHSSAMKSWVIDFVAHNDRCPMLTDDFLCSIYEARPQACRRFPAEPTFGCMVWPGTVDDPPIIAFESKDAEHRAAVVSIGVRHYQKTKADPTKVPTLGASLRRKG